MKINVRDTSKKEEQKSLKSRVRPIPVKEPSAKKITVTEQSAPSHPPKKAKPTPARPLPQKPATPPRREKTRPAPRPTKPVSKKKHFKPFKKIPLIIAVISLIGIGLFSYATQGTSEEGETLTAQQDISEGNPDTPKGTPEFRTMTPGGDSIDDYGGWHRVSPPNQDPAWAYGDQIGNVSIAVSQQLIPQESQKNSKEFVEETATDFGATNTLQAGNTLAYIGSSAKGPQSVIFAKDNVLVLIKSVGKISDSDWTSYIRDLQY